MHGEGTMFRHSAMDTAGKFEHHCLKARVFLDVPHFDHSIFGITENLDQSLMDFDPYDPCGMTLEHCHWFGWNVWIPDPNHMIQTASHQDIQVLIVIERLDALVNVEDVGFLEVLPVSRGDNQ